MKRTTASILSLIALLLLGSTANAASRGTIRLGPSASGEAVRILGTGYTLQRLSGHACPGCVGVIVGPRDLFTSWIVHRLQADYEAGQAVGLTDARQATIQRLHHLLQHRGSAEPVPVGLRVDLIAFRKAFRKDGPLNYSSHILLPREAAAKSPLLTEQEKQQIKRVYNRGLRQKLRKKLTKLRQQQREQEQAQAQARADRNDIRALSRIFSARAFLPPPPPGDSDDEQNLLDLAESYQSQVIQSDSYGNQIQLINSVWAVRSFTNSLDLYYVLQEADYHVVPEPSNTKLALNSWEPGVNSILSGPPTVIAPSPQTTMETTEDTSSTNYSIGGDLGWDQTQGVNALVNGSLSISNSKTTTIPPIIITNNTNLVTGETAWTYEVKKLTTPDPQTLDFFSQWIWSLPFTAYTTGQEEIQFNSATNFGAVYVNEKYPNQKTDDNFSANVTSKVPLPFGQTFALQPPVVTGLSSSSVQVGTTFTIQGTGFYPSLVEAVLIGGTSVNLDNVTPVSDTQIQVVAPNTGTDCLTGCTVVVRTTQGASNDNFTITIQ